MKKCVEIRRIFFSHRQTKRQNCQKQSFSRQKSSKYFVFCLVTYSPSMLPLNKTCLSCFFLLKTNTIDNLAFFRKPPQNNACLSCICSHKNLAYLSFSQLVKNRQTTFGEDGGVRRNTAHFCIKKEVPFQTVPIREFLFLIKVQHTILH